MENASDKLDSFEKMFQTGFTGYAPVKLESTKKANNTKPSKLERTIEVKPVTMEKKEQNNRLETKQPPKPVLRTMPESKRKAE